MSDRGVVVKVGGSLLHSVNLVDQLRGWIALQGDTRVVLLTGGGPYPKELRLKGDMDEETAHWLAIRMMQFQTRQLCRSYQGGVMVSNWRHAKEIWERDCQPFFNVGPFLREDDTSQDRLPHTWDVSSDSIAARVAVRHDADLVLIKSCPVTPGPYDWPELARLGVVDEWFPQIAPAVANITLANLPG